MEKQYFRRGLRRRLKEYGLRGCGIILALERVKTGAGELCVGIRGWLDHIELLETLNAGPEIGRCARVDRITGVLGWMGDGWGGFRGRGCKRRGLKS